MADDPARPSRRKTWTRARQAAFLRELAVSNSVERAARSVGMGRQSAYKLRRRLAGTPFDEAWDLAREAGARRVRGARLRALSGPFDEPGWPIAPRLARASSVALSPDGAQVVDPAAYRKRHSG